MWDCLTCFGIFTAFFLSLSRPSFWFTFHMWIEQWIASYIQLKHTRFCSAYVAWPHSVFVAVRPFLVRICNAHLNHFAYKHNALIRSTLFNLHDLWTNCWRSKSIHTLSLISIRKLLPRISYNRYKRAEYDKSIYTKIRLMEKRQPKLFIQLKKMVLRFVCWTCCWLFFRTQLSFESWFYVVNKSFFLLVDYRFNFNATFGIGIPNKCTQVHFRRQLEREISSFFSMPLHRCKLIKLKFAKPNNK